MSRSVNRPDKYQKSKGKKKEVSTLGPPEQTKSIFIWMSEQQMVFDKLKAALTTAPVLGYPDFTKEFILETDASLKELGAVLSQEDNTGKVCDISYVSQTLRPSKQSMHNYSSTKLELLALKWAVTRSFGTICWGRYFTADTDNNPLAYI